ncbi:MAG: glycosyltransferase [Pseudomonadota bacterium]
MTEHSPKANPSKVTVIVPTYNRAHFVAESLNAILPQLEPQDELIVIDDGSEDQTLEVLAGFGDSIKLITQKNTGKPTALNCAFEHASGDLIWIVDDDDLVASDARSRLVTALEATPGAGFAYGRHERFFDDEVTGDRHFLGTGYWCECNPEGFLCATLEDFFAHQPGMMVRKSLYDEVGSFSNAFSEDYDMLIRLALVSRPIAIPGILFYQRQHTGLRGTAANPVKIHQRDRAWIGSGQDIIKQYLAELPLERFLPGHEALDERATRRALLQRGVIFARHSLWLEAAEEFNRAAKQSDAPFDQAEQTLVRRASQSKFNSESFLQDRIAYQALMRLARSNAVGRSLVRLIGRSFVWRGREAYRAQRWTTALSYSRRIFRMWILAR